MATVLFLGVFSRLKILKNKTFGTFPSCAIKILAIRTLEIIVVIVLSDYHTCPKIGITWLYSAVICRKAADGIAKCVEPDQTARAPLHIQSSR